MALRVRAAKSGTRKGLGLDGPCPSSAACFFATLAAAAIAPPSLVIPQGIAPPTLVMAAGSGGRRGAVRFRLDGGVLHVEAEEEAPHGLEACHRSAISSHTYIETAPTLRLLG